MLGAVLWCGAVSAHEGHDHGPAPAARASAPSAEARSESFALSAVAVAGAVLLYLDHPASNEPLDGAQIDVETPDGPARAAASGSGTYRLPAPWLKPGRQGLIVTVSRNDVTDALPIVLDIPAGALGGPGAPHRHGDGTVGLPKATQRLFNVRTVVAAATTEPVSVELMGRTVPDPNASARVRAVRDGTVEPGEGGLPHVGQRVARGDVLARLAVVLPAAEETALRQKLVEIEREQALLGPRAEHASVVNPNMPMGDAAVALLNEIQVQSQALTRQAELIKAALAQRIEVKAPVDGAIASVALRAGELVATRDVLMEIVDPAKARVEAYAFSPAPGDIKGATAVTDDGRTLALTFLAQGPMLRGQAVPLTFQVKEGGPVPFGTAVRVHVKGGEAREGIKLPRAALQRSGGAQVVFEHVDAETFAPRQVSAEPLDAEHVLVRGEVTPGMRVVTGGAVFIAQVR